MDMHWAHRHFDSASRGAGPTRGSWFLVSVPKRLQRSTTHFVITRQSSWTLNNMLAAVSCAKSCGTETQQ